MWLLLTNIEGVLIVNAGTIKLETSHIDKRGLVKTYKFAVKCTDGSITNVLTTP